ncbi:MAG: hypothetical protein A2487_16645 [Candidatus Raymondbacteria bacterium RifOxyC12_full_50_8]|nr:MAG: hypothetical protein A2350_13740 [Candidatus Raymondbacteria bacterium RifOxyB12_full_50_8]OGJ94411.1 MAG: hypothetical protein A2487_16645 [Candidatus Raymondbacteria bacterium RifOxyC12_full_50_8]
MKKKLYIETSVWNQLAHTDRPDWKRATEDFIKTVESGIYEIYVSELVLKEIDRTHDKNLQKTLTDHIFSRQPEVLLYDEEARRLVEAYRGADIIKSSKPKVIIDMGHVAIATVNGIRHIISYNFDHLVNEFKIDKFNSVNLNQGYDVIVDIKTPESYILKEEGQE